MLADSVDPDQIALEQYEQGLLCLPVILLNAHNTLIQKQKILKTTLSRCLLAPEKMHAFFLMYQVDSGHLHLTSKKIPVCDIDYHKSSEYWDR